MQVAFIDQFLVRSANSASGKTGHTLGEVARQHRAKVTNEIERESDKSKEKVAQKRNIK